MSLTQCFIPILSYWEWENRIIGKIHAKIGPPSTTISCRRSHSKNFDLQDIC